MGWFADEDDVPVELDCRCPNTPHEKDTVWLRPQLGVEGGMAADVLWREGATSVGAMVGKLAQAYLQFGITRWTFTDDAGQPVPCDPLTIARFTKNWTAAREVAEVADTLYSESILTPLLGRALTSLRPGQTARSTSASRTTTTNRPRRSKRSTTATTQPRLQVIESSSGDSSTSPKRKSAST